MHYVQHYKYQIFIVSVVKYMVSIFLKTSIVPKSAPEQLHLTISLSTFLMVVVVFLKKIHKFFGTHAIKRWSLDEVFSLKYGPYDLFLEQTSGLKKHCMTAKARSGKGILAWLSCLLGHMSVKLCATW